MQMSSVRVNAPTSVIIPDTETHFKTSEALILSRRDRTQVFSASNTPDRQAARESFDLVTGLQYLRAHETLPIRGPNVQAKAQHAP